LAFAAMLFLSALGTGTLISMLFGDRRPIGFPMHLPAWQVMAVVWLLLLTILIVGMRRVGRPLGSVVEAAGRVAEGDYSARVPEHGPPSLSMVGRAFNSMAQRLEVHDRQRRELMADIAHELRTPLSVIQARLEGLLDGIYPRDEAQLTQILGDINLLSRLVDDLRTLAHSESGTLLLQKESTDLAVLIHDAVETFSADAAQRHVSVVVETPGDLPLVLVDPLRIRQVLTNLLANALRHTPAGGSVTVTATANNEGVRITVSDTGQGIAPEELSKIFDRFYKGPDSPGSGLGLTIARNLVEAHGGTISASSDPQRGTEIAVTLPLL